MEYLGQDNPLTASQSQVYVLHFPVVIAHAQSGSISSLLFSQAPVWVCTVQFVLILSTGLQCPHSASCSGSPDVVGGRQSTCDGLLSVQGVSVREGAKGPRQ